MGTLSNEEIGAIERELASAFGSVDLLCDGYRVRVEVRPIKARTYVLAVFINGWFKGEWIMSDCEERRRFLRRSEVSLYRPSQRARLVKTFGKRGVLKHFPDLNAKRFYWSSNWNTVRPMLRHFCANNQSVEVVAIGITGSIGNRTAEAEADNA